MSEPGRAPLPLTVARVLATLQAVAGTVGVVVGGLTVVASSGTDRVADAGGEPNPWSGFAVVIGAAVSVAGLVTLVLLGLPLLVLRGGSPTRRVTGRGLLVGGELLLLLPLVVFFHVQFQTVGRSGLDPFSLVFDALLVVPLVVVGCLLAPSVGRWADADADAGAGGIRVPGGS